MIIIQRTIYYHTRVIYMEKIYIYRTVLAARSTGRTLRKRTVAAAAVYYNNNNDNIIIIKQTTLKKSLWMGQFRDRWTRGRWALLVKRVRRDFYILIRGHNKVYKTINILRNTHTHTYTHTHVCAFDT